MSQLPERMEELNAVDKRSWPKLFGQEMTDAKRIALGKHREAL